MPPSLSIPFINAGTVQNNDVKLIRLQSKMWLYSRRKMTVLAVMVGPYDFRAMENTDGIAEFDDKNGNNSKTRSMVEFAKMWMQFIKIWVFPPL